MRNVVQSLSGRYELPGSRRNSRRQLHGLLRKNASERHGQQMHLGVRGLACVLFRVVEEHERRFLLPTHRRQKLRFRNVSLERVHRRRVTLPKRTQQARAASCSVTDRETQGSTNARKASSTPALSNSPCPKSIDPEKRPASTTPGPLEATPRTAAAPP